MSTISPDSLRLRVSTEELVDILGRLQSQQELLLELLDAQERALVEVRAAELDELKDREEGLLREIIEEEKERLLVTEEIGDLLDHDYPAALRVAELLPHLPEDLAVKVTSAREELRDIALRLARQNSINRALIEHSIGHIQIFMSKLAAEDAAGTLYDDSGTAAGDDCNAFIMDRRV